MKYLNNYNNCKWTHCDLYYFVDHNVIINNINNYHHHPSHSTMTNNKQI